MKISWFFCHSDFQILREINFADSRSFSNSSGSENEQFGKFHPSENAKIHMNHNSEPLSKCVKIAFALREFKKVI